MKTRTRQTFFALLTVMIWASADSALAGPVTIVNPSFETQTLANGNFIANTITGWTVVLSASAAGVINPTALQVSGGNVPDGNNTAFSSNDMVFQTLSATLTANTQYTLQAYVGRLLPPTPFPGYRVQLFAGSTLLAEDNSLLSPTPGTFQQTTISYLATNSDPLLGQQLKIQFKSVGSQTYFDDFHLDATVVSATVPEPGTLTLFGTGVFGLLVAYRRRCAAKCD